MGFHFACLLVLANVLTVRAACPVGWASLSTGCYLFNEASDGDYEDAKAVCQDKGGFLAEINGQEEQDILWQFCQDNEIDKNIAWWLGASDKFKEGEWKWERTGVIFFNAGQTVTYDAFSTGEPNNVGNGEDCLVADSDGRKFRWVDIPCNTKVWKWRKVKALCEYSQTTEIFIPGSECTGGYEYDVEYTHNDMRSCGGNKKPTPEACQEFCQSILGCVGWEWGYHGDNCCAKSEMASRKTGKSGRVAGLINACPPVCGIENLNIKKNHRIIGGLETEPNQYPWMVRFEKPRCGGSLITEKHVLTAAHCVNLRQLEGATAKVGVHNENDPNYYQEVSIEKWICPGDCLDTNDDIAIVTLLESVDLSDRNIGIVCLPNYINEDFGGKTALAMGWGLTSDTASQSEVLQEVELTVALEHVTYPSSPANPKNWLFTEVETLNEIPRDACDGDSGGPLVHKNEKSGQWTVIGVRSTGGDCTNHSGRQGKWDNVMTHLVWIKENI